MVAANFNWANGAMIRTGKSLFRISAGAPVGMWTWRRVHTKFWQPAKPYLNQGVRGWADYICPPYTSVHTNC